MRKVLRSVLVVLPTLGVTLPVNAGVGEYMCDVVRRPWIEYYQENKNFPESFGINNKPVSEWGYQVKFHVDWQSKTKALIKVVKPIFERTYEFTNLMTEFHGEDMLGFIGTTKYYGWGMTYASFSKDYRLLLVEQIGDTNRDNYDVYVWHAKCYKFK